MFDDSGDIVVTARREDKHLQQFKWKSQATVDDGASTGNSEAPSNSPEIPHSETSPCSTGAAEQIAEKIKAKLVEIGNVEIGGVVVENADGSFGADQTGIHTDYSPRYAELAVPSDVTTARGIVHNHLWNSDISAPTDANHGNRYPSDGDWDALEQLANPSDGRPGADPSDLSLFILDPWGTLREFKYTDRESYRNLTRAERSDGVNLPSETNGCPG